MTITVYSKPNCIACDRTKKFLDSKGIDYTPVDITEDPAAYEKVTNMGFMAAPVVVVEGGDAWSGYQREKLTALV